MPTTSTRWSGSLPGVSDLQCAATVIAAVHAEAGHENDGMVDPGGSLTMVGREQARRLGESLLHHPVTVVYCSGMVPAVQTAGIAAGVLGASVELRAALGESPTGGPAVETVEDVIDRMCAELHAISDLHRGETVLVVSERGALGPALRRLTGAHIFTADPAGVGDCEPVELAADADDWVVRS
jgi:probable phosphoglycerate mutase